MKKLIAKALLFCLVATGFALSSCQEKLDEIEGMDNKNMYYSYKAESTDLKYQEAVAPFNLAISKAVGSKPIQGGNDTKVIDACNACYDEFKTTLKKKGTVDIFKIRQLDGRQKRIMFYTFKK